MGHVSVGLGLGVFFMITTNVRGTLEIYWGMLKLHNCCRKIYVTGPIETMTGSILVAQRRFSQPESLSLNSGRRTFYWG